MSLERVADTRRDRRAIARAESLPAGAPPTPSLAGEIDEDAPSWFRGEMDGVRVPRAVTEEAIRYYLDMTECLRANGGWVGERWMEFSSMAYSARILPPDASPVGVPPRARVVVMELTWEHGCGDGCGATIGLRRLVAVQRGGEAVVLQGDNDVSVAVP